MQVQNNVIGTDIGHAYRFAKFLFALGLVRFINESVRPSYIYIYIYIKHTVSSKNLDFGCYIPL